LKPIIRLTARRIANEVMNDRIFGALSGDDFIIKYNEEEGLSNELVGIEVSGVRVR
jgi:hypothetical protein